MATTTTTDRVEKHQLAEYLAKYVNVTTIRKDNHSRNFPR
jgi:hypothetical protein